MIRCAGTQTAECYFLAFLVFSERGVCLGDENVAISLCLIIIASAALRIRCDRRRPRQWTRAWIHRRRQLGAHHALMKKLESEDPQSYRNFIRMDKQDFDELLTKVTPFIQRRDTNMRESITPTERLSLTLRYLGTGDSYHSLSYLYRVPVPTLSETIPETCQALYLCLKEDYMKVRYFCFINALSLISVTFNEP